MKFFPTNFSKLPLKKIGYKAYVHIHEQHRDKVNPRALKYILVKYSFTQKWYKHYYPTTTKIFHFKKITFDD